MLASPVPHRRRHREQSAERDLHARSGQFVVVAGPVLGFAAAMDPDEANIGTAEMLLFRYCGQG
jgi:hypothetical protein